MCLHVLFFFFSSRRRHTRCSRDWSSDVCSSDLPRPSQSASVSQRVGITDIAIHYSRPLVRNRKLWGGLVPYDQVWRAGANENTTITFSDPVAVEGQPITAGAYGLHMIPHETDC